MGETKAGPLGGLKRIFKSSKGTAAVIAVLSIVLVQVLKLEAEMAQTLSIAIGSLAALYIAGTAYEDGGAKRGGGVKLLAAGLLLSLVAGCCPLARPANTFLGSAGAELKAYWTADQNLGEREKQIRMDHLAMFTAAVKAANE